ncbi:MAG: hypothetical protein LBJ12_05705 [Oscillospiraceae bacterium]|nr:hypothetical protein [Oscillospiraceae bacterium]
MATFPKTRRLEPPGLGKSYTITQDFEKKTCFFKKVMLYLVPESAKKEKGWFYQKNLHLILEFSQNEFDFTKYFL